LKSFCIGDLKIPVPIVQGGMGIGISLSELVSAVADKGGIGVISTVGTGLIDNNIMKESVVTNIIRDLKKLTKREICFFRVLKPKRTCFTKKF
jgi:NAD(P)H-dependent flavin oxidoreductase YrpB (nitropropane dioxygenase family)